ncbi:MAG: ribosome biogenesis GTPase YlqF [Armatimonadetes bacterium]|nr:ribosome biogenesis GTPase YlqF [Armatimonadota bacterium]
MRKARRELEQSLRLADAVLMVLDARAPASTRHLELERSLRNRPIILVLNKEDLAEKEATRAWIQTLSQEGATAVALTSTGGQGAGPLRPHLERIRQRLHQDLAAKGVRPRPPRLIVAGVPNVGKSSLLNRLVGRKRAKTGAKPGVTRGPQWVVAEGLWQVLDTPGILYPRIQGAEQFTHLLAVGCVRREAVAFDEAAGRLVQILAERGLREELLGPCEVSDSPVENLIRVARHKTYFQHGEVDVERAAHWLLQSFAEGRFGRITLERIA